MECVLEVMEQPAERVKFRTEVKRYLFVKPSFKMTNLKITLKYFNQVHGHRCQQRELLLGQVRQNSLLALHPCLIFADCDAGRDGGFSQSPSTSETRPLPPSGHPDQNEPR